MRALGVLAGVGSLLRECADAGFEVVGNLEPRTPYITGRSLSWDLNFPQIPLVRTISDGSFANWTRPDLVIGHPPCGSHSQLGNSGQPADLTLEERRVRQARRHARVGLLPFYCESIAHYKPRMFVLDNLPKILTSVAPREWWSELLPKYRLEFITMMNWDYGTPQLRKRLWIVGTRRSLPQFRFKPIKRRPKGAPTTALDAFFGLSPWPYQNETSVGHVHVPPFQMLTGDYRTTRTDGLSVTMASQLALGFLSIPPNKAWPYRTSRGRIAVKIGRSRLPIDEKSRTITGLPSIHHPITGWPLTARERARLMDWPDDFHLGNAETTYDRYALMRLTLFTGKAVPSAFPRYLLPQVLEHLERHQ